MWEKEGETGGYGGSGFELWGVGLVVEVGRLERGFVLWVGVCSGWEKSRIKKGRHRRMVCSTNGLHWSSRDKEKKSAQRMWTGDLEAERESVFAKQTGPSSPTCVFRLKISSARGGNVTGYSR